MHSPETLKKNHELEKKKTKNKRKEKKKKKKENIKLGKQLDQLSTCYLLSVLQNFQ